MPAASWPSAQPAQWVLAGLLQTVQAVFGVSDVSMVDNGVRLDSREWEF